LRQQWFVDDHPVVLLNFAAVVFFIVTVGIFFSDLVIIYQIQTSYNDRDHVWTSEYLVRADFCNLIFLVFPFPRFIFD